MTATEWKSALAKIPRDDWARSWEFENKYEINR